jgi:cytochrome c oxidase assembly protein subunit 19
MPYLDLVGADIIFQLLLSLQCHLINHIHPVNILNQLLPNQQMSLPPGSQKTHRPTPPQRGSFPLDHLAECKATMLSYLACLKHSRGLNDQCRSQAKTYLQCRMDKGLMTNEEMQVLGFASEDREEGSAAGRQIEKVGLETIPKGGHAHSRPWRGTREGG